MDNYSIYKFTFSDGKIYIGQTCQPLEERWKNGDGYKGQDVYVPIILDGWENVKKEILHTNLTQAQANDLEKHYIKKFNSIKNGYNRSSGGNNNMTKIINVEIEDNYFLIFMKKNIGNIKANALKLLIYFLLNNHMKIKFLPSQIMPTLNISENTCRSALEQLMEIGIIKPASTAGEYDLIIHS